MREAEILPAHLGICGEKCRNSTGAPLKRKIASSGGYFHGRVNEDVPFCGGGTLQFGDLRLFALCAD